MLFNSVVQAASCEPGAEALSFTVHKKFTKSTKP
ncbi:MAG: hypothetical protein JWM28_2800 [Chitinophagaceae bacterium]|nr:hypothetical protein [Chitinophagaceae bacterium]